MQKQKMGLRTGDIMISDYTTSMVNFYRGRKPLHDLIIRHSEVEAKLLAKTIAFASGLVISKITTRDSEQIFEFV
jgi:hypothetical protein